MSPIHRPKFRLSAEVLGVARATFALPSLLFGKDDLPRGGGAPVMLLPGYMASHGSLLVMRAFLRSLGFRAETWGWAATAATSTR